MASTAQEQLPLLFLAVGTTQILKRMANRMGYNVARKCNAAKQSSVKPQNLASREDDGSTSSRAETHIGRKRRN